MRVFTRGWMALAWLVALGVLTGCASTPGGGAGGLSAQAYPQGILIIYGQGLIPTYDDPTLSSLPYAASEAFANGAYQDLVRRKVPAQVFANHDKALKTADYLGHLLARQPRSAILQVQFVHQKNGSVYSLALEPTLFTLSQSPDGSFTVGRPVISKSYVLMANGVDNRHASISVMARDFLAKVHSEGQR